MKIHILLVAAFICFLPTFTISQDIEWQNTIGGSDMDNLTSISETADGGFICGGYSNSNISGDKTENSLGLTDYWVVKLDHSGNIQWQNTIGGDSVDRLWSISPTTDGGYICGGYSFSNTSGDKTENCQGIVDYWVVKLDDVGNIQWQNTIGGSGTDILVSISQTPDGGFICGGESSSDISGDKTENTIGWGGYPDYWVVKLDMAGNIQWQNTIGGEGREYFKEIKPTADGGYICSGFSESYISGDKSEDSQGMHDFWIVKLNASGNIQWQNTIGGSLSDYLETIALTIDGGYICGGRSDSNISGDKTENCHNLTDYWVVKLDVSGNIQWQNTIGGNGRDELYSITQSMDGGYICGGQSNSNISADKTEESHGNHEYWVVSLDSSGNIRWQNTIGGNNWDGISSIANTSDNEYICGGFSRSDLSGDKTEICQGPQDFWVVKLNNNHNLINGTVFADFDSNNIHDINEPFLPGILVTELNTGKFGFSEQNGVYYTSVSDTGNFSVSPSALNYYTAVPITQSASFTGIHQTDSLNDFAFQPAGVFNDLCVTLTPLSPFRAGFDASYMITYENVGTTTLSPTVIFFADDDVSFVSATPVASTVTLDSVVWDFGPLAPFQTGNILVTVNVTIGTPIGTVISSGAHIEPLSGDANTICNQSYWEVLTTGSADPNDIIVNQDTLLTNQFPNPPLLEYIIRFQNTGNDTAFTVNILNPIDTSMLELNTIEFVASSHPVNLTWIPWEKNMQYKFENILLPDSNVNEPGSHGFVRYRIKPKSSLTLGDSITNNAAIYFDFNAPVITNTVITRVVLPTSLTENSAHFDNLLLYPNPANSTLTIETGNLLASDCKLIISDVAGRMLYSKSIVATATKHNIDISSFSQGIYFVQLQTGENISRGRFVKE